MVLGTVRKVIGSTMLGRWREPAGRCVTHLPLLLELQNQ